MGSERAAVNPPIRVVLVNPPIPANVYRHQPYLPLGLAYLAAVLDDEGCDVKVVDCPAMGLDHHALSRIISDFEPTLVGITSMTPTINSAIKSAEVIKEAHSDALVALGGPHATFMDQDILADHLSVDIIVRGEGEATILEVVKHLSRGRKLNGIAGITIRDGGRIIRNPPREYLDNLDKLPHPAYHHFQLEQYSLYGKRLLPIMTGRGCPFQCSFCITSRFFGRRYRARSPSNVVDELVLLKDKYGADAFTFYDDTITLERNRILKICREMRSRKIDLPWDCQTRVDTISKEILSEMKQAGCQQVFFGVESGSQKMLDLIGKGTTVEQNERAIKIAKEVGLFVSISVIIGYPGETAETLKQTMEFINRTKPDDVYICIATPYPGTELYERIKNLGWKISSNWDKFDTTNLVYEHPLLSADALNEFRRRFYDTYYSPSYVFKHIFKRNFYSRIMARTAINHIIWKMRSQFFPPQFQ